MRSDQHLGTSFPRILLSFCSTSLHFAPLDCIIEYHFSFFKTIFSQLAPIRKKKRQKLAMKKQAFVNVESTTEHLFIMIIYIQ